MKSVKVQSHQSHQENTPETPNAVSIVEEWFKDAPHVLSRAEVVRRTGNVIAIKSMANADSRGDGISERFYVGRNVCYPTSAVIDWLSNRLTIVGTKTDDIEEVPSHE